MPTTGAGVREVATREAIEGEPPEGFLVLV